MDLKRTLVLIDRVSTYFQGMIEIPHRPCTLLCTALQSTVRWHTKENSKQLASLMRFGAPVCTF